MKLASSLNLALCACLLAAAVAFTGEAHAQAKENANFEAGIAAYHANDLPLAYKKFLTLPKRSHSQFNVALRQKAR